MRAAEGRRLPILRLAGLTAAALAIHGYHMGVEDAEIFTPAARKLLQPELYPFATEFFEKHAHLSLFSPILAWTARLTHLSMDCTIFVWYLACLFGIVAGCWLLAAVCFESARARWGAVVIVTMVLAMPVANTALPLMDPYLTARSFSTPLSLFALAWLLERRYLWAALATLLTATIHPQMAAYLVFLAGVMWLADRTRKPVRERAPALMALTALSALPGGFQLVPASGPYREALYSRDFFFLYNWSWYDWMGLLAPLSILGCFWKGNFRGTRAGFHRLSFALIPFGLISIAAAAVFASSPVFDSFERLQPLRSFHLITMVFVLFLGGVMAEYVGRFTIRGTPWVVATVAVLLAAGMVVVARQSYPRSPQIEWPSATNSNPWVKALVWARDNTPVDAVFAVDARYFKDNDTDAHGFRATAQRSVLADYWKDGGVASLFPELAGEWKQMSDATSGLNRFQKDDFARLAQAYPVTWVVVHGAAPAGMDCPYDAENYAVCRIGAASR